MITREDVQRVASACEVEMDPYLGTYTVHVGKLHKVCERIAALAVEREKINAGPQGNMESNGTANPVVRPAVSAPDVEADWWVIHFYGPVAIFKEKYEAENELARRNKKWPETCPPRQLFRAYSESSVAALIEKARQPLQARIDALMLEYCPDEMTPEQMDNWERHQKRASPEDERAIDEAIRQRGEK